MFVLVFLGRVSSLVTLMGLWCATSLMMKAQGILRWTSIRSDSYYHKYSLLPYTHDSDVFIDLCSAVFHLRVSCWLTLAPRMLWPGVQTASWWAAAIRRWWRTAGMAKSCRTLTTAETEQSESSPWRPPAPADSLWCSAASTGQFEAVSVVLLWKHRAAIQAETQTNKVQEEFIVLTCLYDTIYLFSNVIIYHSKIKLILFYTVYI